MDSQAVVSVQKKSFKFAVKIEGGKKGASFHQDALKWVFYFLHSHRRLGVLTILTKEYENLNKKVIKILTKGYLNFNMRLFKILNKI